MKRSILLLAVLFFASTARGGLPPTMRLDVTLDEAVWASPDHKLPLRVKLVRNHGSWEQAVFADARRLSQGNHWGMLKANDLGDNGGTFDVTLKIEPDPWRDTSGYAKYRVVIDKDGNGTWEGEFNGEAAKGAARAMVRPLVETAASRGRPRFLFRVEDLPTLQAKAKTEWGKAWLARVESLAKSDPDKSSRAVACGFLYQLTGDKAQAAEAQRLIEEDVLNWYNVQYVHGAAVRVMQGALAFDLIAEACDADFRGRMREVFRRKCRYLYFPPVGGFNSNDASNWSAMYRSALGLAALSVLADPSPMQIEPLTDQIFEPQPVQKSLGHVVPLQPRQNITAWDYAGPVAVAMGADALQVEFGASVPLAPQHFITEQQAKSYENAKLAGGLDFASVTGRNYFTANQLTATLQVEKDGLYRLEFGDRKMEQVIVWLAGHRLNNHDVVRLEPGLYQLKVVVSIGAVGNWEMLEWYLHFNPLTGDQAAAWVRERQRVLALSDVSEAERWLGIGRQCIANWSEQALGDHGWNMEGEAYTQHALRCILPFERAHRNAMGRSLFPDERVAAMYPLYTAKTVFGSDRALMPSYGPGGGPLGVDNWARGYFLVPKPQRPATLWAWNRTLALADKGALKMAERPVDEFDALSAVCHFIDYPLDVKEANPVETLPRVTADAKKGGYVFRNRWQDGDDFVATFFIDSDSDQGGWRAPDWLAFRIVGFGTEWAARGIAWGNGASARRLPNARLYGNVPFVPEAWQCPEPARTLKFVSHPDGSGMVTSKYRMEVTASTGKEIAVANKPKSENRAFVDGTRWFAVDYSGDSGATCLVAIADTLTGSGGTNTWQFCTLAEHKVTVNDSGFTINDGNGASLVARVVQPAGAKVTVEPVTIRHEINYHGRHAQADFKRQVINVPGDKTFFVVLTIQKGEPPSTRLEDEKTVVIGKRKVRLDGSELSLEAAIPGLSSGP